MDATITTARVRLIPPGGVYRFLIQQTLLGLGLLSILIVMAEQFVFTFNGAYLKAIVNAYRQIADSFVFHFTDENVSTCVMGTDGSRAIQIILKPLDYRARQDEAWVSGSMDLLWGAVKKLKKAETAKVWVEDDKLCVMRGAQN